MAKVAPNNAKVILDNDKVRVLDVQFKKGEKLPMHSHPGNIIYSFDGGKTKTTLGDAMYRKLKVYAGPKHPHAAQKPSQFEVA